MPVYTFGGNSVQPGEASYASFSLTASITLAFPAFAAPGANTFALILDFTANAGGYAITLPDARQAGNGTTVLFRNTGANTVEIKDNTGASLTTIGAGVAKFFYLTDNSSQGGSWGIVTFGTGTSSADASLLASYGLQVLSGMLAQAHPTVSTSATINVSTPSDLAKVYVATGGSVAANLPTSASAGSNFFVIIKNNGSGTVTITPNGADVIDGSASLALVPGDAAIICSLGSANGWVSVGYGRSVNFAFTQLVKNVAGSANVDLTSAECANKVIQLTGLLTGNIEVRVTSTVSVYYVHNNTTGPFTLTVKTLAGTGVTVAQGTHDVLVCDGTNVYRAVDNTTASTVFGLGSAAAPTVTFTSNTTTGLYIHSASVLGISANGLTVLTLNAPGGSVNYAELFASTTGNPPSLRANGTDATVNLALRPKGNTGSIDLQNVSGVSIANFLSVASAVNWLEVAQAATTVRPTITAKGETNVGIRLVPKGTGRVQITDGTDTTKVGEFILSGITTANTRSYTLPDFDGTLATLAGAETFTNKTLTSPAISGGTINNAVIGGSTPAAGTFTTLTANGNCQFGDNVADTVLIQANVTTLNGSGPTIRSITAALLIDDLSSSGLSIESSGGGPITIGANVNTQNVTIGRNGADLIINSGQVFQGDTANTFNLGGLTINQGANDDEILSLKSSDVAHGMTSQTETDTYATFTKSSATAGGLRIDGFSSATRGVLIAGSHTTDDTTKSTAANGAVDIRGLLKSGTTVGSMGADANALVVRNQTTTRFILDADGESYQDVGTSWINFDFMDDVKVMDALAVALNRGDPLKLSFLQSLEESRALLEKIPGKKLVHFNKDGHHFINTSRFLWLHHGAIRQNYREIAALRSEVAEYRGLLERMQRALPQLGA